MKYLVGLLLTLAACGSGETTWDDVNTRVAEAYCHSRADCGFNVKGDEMQGYCVNDFVAVACRGDACSDPPPSEESVAACVAAFEDISCEDLGNGVQPDNCQTY